MKIVLQKNSFLRLFPQLIFIFVFSAFQTGCASYSKEWKSSISAPSPKGFEGPWEGAWISQTSGHKDQLRCIVTARPDGLYDAHFKARYRRIFSFSYTTPLTVTESNQVWYFKGQANLGKLAGGLYVYEGWASATNFFSNYNSKYDRGNFQMSRPIQNPKSKS